MPPEPSSKKPLLPGQFAWAASKKDGKFSIRIGPDPLEVTDDDILMVPGQEDPTDLVPVDFPSQAIQRFCVLKPDEYAIIHNPTERYEDSFPNGSFAKGKNDMPALFFGAKRVVTSGNFPIWPNQWVEIRKAHHLSASQYLMVVVESLPIDEKAAYYGLTVACAKIKKAVVDETVGGGENPDPEGDKTAPGTKDKKDPKDSKAPPEKKSDGSEPPGEGKTTKKEEKAPKTDEPLFVVGQRIIIPGNMTPTFIPPSGIEVVPEESAQTTTGDPVLGFTPPEEIIQRKISGGQLDLGELQNFTRRGFLSSSLFSSVKSSFSELRDDQSDDMAFFGAIKKELPPVTIKKLARYLISGQPDPPSQPLETPPQVIREAVVPGPTQFCILIDADGTPQTYKGPGRVFPGPYDRFRMEGSQNGKYDAYHIRPDRGILLRVVAESVKADKLMKQIPGCIDEKKIFEKSVYTKGDEIFIGGFDAYLVPSNAIEVIDPETRKPHIGNDHSNVYVQSIGVDQKSGVYVANVDTGNVKLVQGEKKLLLDPRKEKHLKRRVPGKLWNLMIGRMEPHKMVRESEMVETPWAISVMIPNNEAVLVTSKDGRRVVEGPKTELLAYEEVLEILTLSKGQQKSDDNQLETCFLRVAGNRITDTIELETADFVKILLIVSYGVRFITSAEKKEAKAGDKKEEDKLAWFNYKDYVMLLAANLRSRLKGAAHGRTITDLYPIVPNFVRDIILGAKPEGEGAHRPGLKFDENNMLVEEVEVLSYRIPDTSVAMAMEETNEAIVTRQIVDAQKKAELASDQLRSQIDSARADLTIEAAQRERLVAVRQTEERAETDAKRVEVEHKLALIKQEQSALLQVERDKAADAAAEAARNRTATDERLRIAVDDERRAKLISFRTAFVALQKEYLQAEATADKTRLEAVQTGLIEALEGLGNKELATALANNLPKAGGTLGFLLGTGGMTMLKSMVKGTPFEKALNSLEASGDALEAEAGKTE
jgi:major vault protein